MCFIGAAVAGAMFAESSLFDSSDPPRRIVNTNDKPEELIKARDKATILIMGVDKREDDVGRSDTLMIATVDPRLDQATLLSIPRDTRVKIYGLGYDKINAAYAYGGVELTESTVENFLGIDIDHYIMIDTSSFVKIIDAIGGVDIDVEKRMFYEDPWDDNGGLVIDLYPGQPHMDGKTAVIVIRKATSDASNVSKLLWRRVWTKSPRPKLFRVSRKFCAKSSKPSKRTCRSVSFWKLRAHSKPLNRTVLKRTWCPAIRCTSTT